MYVSLQVVNVFPACIVLQVSKVRECCVLVAADKSRMDVSSIQRHKCTNIVLHNSKLVRIFRKSVPWVMDRAFFRPCLMTQARSTKGPVINYGRGAVGRKGGQSELSLA